MNNGISNILREYLLRQREKNPSLNEAMLSKKMNIPPTTFNRLLNGYSQPNIVTVLKLMQFIPELKKILPREVAEILNVTLKRTSLEYVAVELENLLYDKNNFLCWTLASSSKGVTKEAIKAFLGTPGLKSLSLLEKKQIIRKSDSCYKATQNTILSFQLIKNIVRILTEQYMTDNINNNYIYYLVNTVNQEGIKKIMKAHQKVHQEIQEIMNSEECKGDIPVFSVACSDVLAENQPKEGL